LSSVFWDIFTGYVDDFGVFLQFAPFLLQWHAYLVKLKFSEVKIARSFITAIGIIRTSFSRPELLIKSFFV